MRNNLGNPAQVISTTIIKAPSYKGFLKSEHWKKIRARKLKKQKKCAICKNMFSLHIHHKVYENKKKYFPKMNDLVVLCASCHKGYHDTNGVSGDMKEKTEKFVDENRNLLKKYQREYYERINFIKYL